jgi:multidrug transporter EmrE-like cation transporter
VKDWWDLGLMTVYAISSVSGLILMRAGLPEARALLAAGHWASSAAACAAFGIVLYVAGFAVWLLILSRNELSVAYPIAIGLTLVGTTAAGFWILSEPVTMWRVAGSALVFLGISMLIKS